MLGWMDSGALRTAGYLAVAITATATGWRERRRAADDPELEPAFWYVVAGLFVAMAVGRAGYLGQHTTELMRRATRALGLYERRRPFQEMAMLGVALVSLLLMVAAVEWARTRHHRYLPMTVITLAVIGFAGIRAVSLHQTDVLLHRDAGGIALGALLEGIGLCVALGAAMWRPTWSTSTGVLKDS